MATSVPRPRLHHLALTVTDVDASVRWYEDVFGVQFEMDAPHPGGVGKLLADEQHELVIVLHRHDTNDGALFGETTTGLDHAGFVVPTRADLEAWQAHLETNGVVRSDVADKPLTQSPIADEVYGSVLVFRDPDNIQLEFFAPRAPVALPGNTASVAERYDSIGHVYTRHRTADPRIMQQITRALDGAHSVLNVGAGAGAYEPSEGRVVAVEPSTVMIAQRAVRATPVVQGVAESLPFPDQSFDAALATFTVHHWHDSSRGLREMLRVARRQVILTFDQGDEWLEDFWLTRDYLPQAHFRGTLFSGLSEVLTEIEAPTIEVVPVAFDCRDGFFCAYWRRPHSYLDPDVRASISALALLDDEVLAPGLARLEADLRSGAWHERNHTLLELDTCDFGYRLVVT